MEMFEQLLLGGTRGLRDYEREIIRACARALPAGSERRFDEQVSRLRLVQRYFHARMVTCHFRPGALNDEHLFADRSEELYVAKVRCKQGPYAAACAVVLHRGKLSSLEFSGPRDWKPTSDLRVDSVLILKDPAQTAGPVQKVQHPELGILPEWVEEFGRARDFRPPAEAVTRTSYLNGLDADPPADYQRLLMMTDGFKLAEWEFMGTRARQIVHPDVTWTLLAESVEGTGEEPRALCLSSEQQPGEVILLNQTDDEVEKTFPSLEEAWRYVMRRHGSRTILQ